MAKKILYSSNSSRWATGFGKHSKVLLQYLYSRRNPDGTPKYEVVEACQSLREDDPILRSLPWKGVGLIPANDEEVLEGIPRDAEGNFPPGLLENLRRIVLYGGARIEDVLKAEKPDVFIHCEDPWSTSVIRKNTLRPILPFWETEWWNKGNCVLWTPIDSLPIFTEVVKNADKMPNLWMKAIFAVREMHRLGHKHVDLYPLLFDASGFKSFSEEDKWKNRSKYGIGQDELVLGFVFRNQGRKKPINSLEGLKIFQLANPERKTKFLMITNPFEPGAWDLKQAVNELEINPKDVLVPYTCKVCKQSSLFAIDEVDCRCAATGDCNPSMKDCSHCGTIQSMNHTTIAEGVSEKTLVGFYNLMDGYIQNANSGGFEAGCLESMMCSVPLACPNYSYGETFVESGEVFPLKYILDREIGSNFKKCAVHAESVAEFIQLLHDNQEEMKARGERGRIWAEENLNPGNILSKVENFLDTVPDKEYDWEFITEFPNMNAAMPEEHLSQDEFIKELIKRFFGDEIDEKNQNYIFINDQLNQGATRETIFERSQQIAQQQKNRFQPKFNPKDFLKETGRKRLLYEMAGNFGDSLISLDVLDSLHKTYPDFDIYVSSLPQFKQIYDHVDYITGWIPFTGNKGFKYWEGTRNNEKLIDIYIAPQANQNYIHNGIDRNELHK